MVETNVFRPALIAQSVQTSNVPDAVTETQYAQDRFLAISSGLANPAFQIASDRSKLVENGGSISRGYIRRSSVTTTDPTSPYRLYFMFNPETIQRGYIAYLDQQSLDPGNALFGSNNMAAAPGLLDFDFELLFDRQIEVATDRNHPGTKVDYDYFDLVVRGVVPDSSANGNAIPDNGIMMVNPNSIVVVFGQDLSVQGRVTNAAISFEKFSNQMIPMRLRIQITMKALYIGPVQTIPNYSLFVSQATSEATIPYDNSVVLGSVTSETVKAATFAAVTAPTTSFTSPTGNSTPITGTTDMLSFAKNLLNALDVPVTQSNIDAIVAWERAEGGIDHNNPLNTTQKMPGSTDFNFNNGFPVQTYVSLDQGVQATVITLTNGGYQSIMQALTAGTSPCAVANAIVTTQWGTGPLVQQILGCA